MKRKFVILEVETTKTNAEIKRAALSSSSAGFTVLQVQVNAARKEKKAKVRRKK